MSDMGAGPSRGGVRKKTGTTPTGKPYEAVKSSGGKRTTVEGAKVSYTKSTFPASGSLKKTTERGIENKGKTNSEFKKTASNWSKRGGKMPPKGGK